MAVVVVGGAWQWWQLLPIPLWLVLAMLAAHLGHGPGKRLQDRLWVEWGGPPTTIHMRWATASNLTRLADLHEAINSIVGPSLKLPSLAEEMADPSAADDIYAAAASKLIALTNSADSYPQLKGHLVWYCFRRSLFGLRRVGLVVAYAAAFVGLALALVSSIVGWERAATAGGLFIAIFGVLIAVFLHKVSSTFVREAADRYALELLKSAHTLSRN
ncbi:hypothetical protein QSJ19_02975 [Gordonia sp. ABSL11-1]|uniref:hypothetical protein n=1 Tax=Gordonia sp. ABSL11-1 TaxID=3053924 RepID=UPI002573E511|nr:hypothetical protein [Gordonia sp. ABSL11-1]MDL9944562.1 hypothetical protein [Gordonia sp. ABSL11-1]